ncbi:MAG: SDR family NAD(P)-dependent oxidoreductase [Humidesulfovibrio sp.]|nr:SDR family NAD(P)-dependent oxidoreductase [Humidesulfovibrio sp.]
MRRRRIVIIGATSALAERCARLWLTQGPADLVLVGRDLDKTGRVAMDLRVRHLDADVRVLATDFLDPACVRALVDGIFAEGPVDIALIAHGLLPDQGACQADLDRCQEALLVNGVSPALFAEAFAGRMERAGKGVLALIGSVAGDRGRKTNYVYGAGKGLLARYAQGLQHRLAGTGVAVVLILPGPTDTPMTSHLKGSRGCPPLADADTVARIMVDAIEKRRPVCYAPGKWALIMLVLRHLPRAVFNRLNI